MYVIMADYHTTYTDPNAVETEWDVLQRKHGNLPEKEARAAPPRWAPEREAPGVSRATLGQLDSVDALEALEDAGGLQDDRFLEAYRRRRLKELKGDGTGADDDDDGGESDEGGRGNDMTNMDDAAGNDDGRKGTAASSSSTTYRGTTLVHITSSEFVAEVTNAPANAYVVCHLYKDTHEECAILNQCLAELASRYTGTKFVKIVSTQCIPDFDDRFLPAVLLYRGGKCVRQVVNALRGWGGKETSPERVGVGLEGLVADGGVLREGGATRGEEVAREMVRRMIEEGLGARKAASDEDSDFE